jgi:hypothetical protein
MRDFRFPKDYDYGPQGGGPPFPVLVIGTIIIVVVMILIFWQP